MKKYIIKTYKQISRKLYNLNMGINSKALDSFIVEFPEELTEDIIWSYIIFQFEYWSKIKTNRTLEPSWIFGKKAILRWINKNQYWDYFCSVFAEKYNLYKEVDYYKANLLDSFEEERKKYLNTPEGLINCNASSFFSSKSESCKICKFKKLCQTI